MVDTLLEQLHDPVGYAIPVFFLFIGIELLALRFHDDGDEVPPKGYSGIDSRTSLSMGLGSVVVGLFLRSGSLVVYALLYVYVAPWHLPANSWPTWVGVLLGVDLLWYVYHRLSHRVRLMWAAHQAHHSSEYFNYSTALRQKWNQYFELLMWLPLPLLGVPPWMIFTAFSVNLLYQFLVHTEKIDKLPRWYEFVFNTPSHHRVHHASNPEYLDRNYAGILIVWDRMFGTFAAERHRPTYGLTTPVNTYNLIKLQFHEFAAITRDVRGATRWRDRLGYLFGPPDWRPRKQETATVEA